MSKIFLDKEVTEKKTVDAYCEEIWDSCQTYAESEDERLIEEYLTCGFPSEQIIRYLLKKARDIERDLHYTGN